MPAEDYVSVVGQDYVHWAQDYALANGEPMMRNIIAAVRASGEVPEFAVEIVRVKDEPGDGKTGKGTASAVPTEPADDAALAAEARADLRSAGQPSRLSPRGHGSCSLRAERPSPTTHR